MDGVSGMLAEHTVREVKKLTEIFTLKLHDNNSVLTVHSNKQKGWVEIRGKSSYETRHKPHDPLHRFLDKLDPATVSTLFADDEVTLNPKNPRSAVSIEAVQKLMLDENYSIENSRYIAEYVSPIQLNKLENYIVELFKLQAGVSVRFTHHFQNRINDTRNEQEIKAVEIKETLKEFLRKWKPNLKSLTNDYEAVIHNPGTMLWIPFYVEVNNNIKSFIPKTIIKTKHFQTPNKIIVVNTLTEDGRIVKGVNTTVDVGVNQTSIEAAKFGNTVTRDGFPPTLNSDGTHPEPKYTLKEWAIIEGGHTLEPVVEVPKRKLFDWTKY